MVLIGQAPFTIYKPGLPLLDGRSGRRLLELAGVGLLDFLRHVRPVNLTQEWLAGQGDKTARAAVAALRAGLSGRRVLLLGREAAKSFGVDGACWGRKHILPDGFTYRLLPHPSSANLFWNDKMFELMASAILREEIVTSMALRRNQKALAAAGAAGTVEDLHGEH